ncbi:MAG: potassium channel family protein [Microthrixaceae bacterium]|nr:potassium channel family protein [Microthrixaceae bacterium]
MPNDASAHEAEHAPLAPVLWFSLLVMVITPFFAPTALGRAATTLLLGGTAVMALRRSGARRSVVFAGEATVVVFAVISLLSRELGSTDNALSVVGTALVCVLLLVTPAVVVVRLAERPRVTLDTVAGALAAYLQIGLFFASLYRLVGLVETTPFFGSAPDGTVMNYQFFSFVTLTTLGYGNLVPVTDVGKSLAMLEAVLGQVFLVTVVAMAVSNLGGTVRSRRS